MTEFLKATTTGIARTAAMAAICLLLPACNRDLDNVGGSKAKGGEARQVESTESAIQARSDRSSPDGVYVATVAEKLAENTTGTVPRLYIRRSNAMPAEAIHVFDGDLNGEFQVSWTGPRALSVTYSMEVGMPSLPASTNVDGITVTAERR